VSALALKQAEAKLARILTDQLEGWLMRPDSAPWPVIGCQLFS
jgi:hypothetical protein